MSFKGLITGVSGLQAQSKKMEVIGNNLANLNTTGFKKGEVTFHELFHDTLSMASGGDGGNLGGTNAKTVGTGVSVSSITNIHNQGTRISTGRTLDFMIEGDDFFVVQNGADQSLMLGRSGSFALDSNYNLVDNIGNKVQGFTVNRETGLVSEQAGSISIDNNAIDPNATTIVSMQSNIDSSVSEQIATTDSNAWTVFSGGENFGAMGISIPGGTGSRDSYGSGFYQDSTLYQDTTATLDGTRTIITLGGAPAGLIEGFAVGDTVSVLQGTNQTQRTVSAVGAGTVTLSTATPVAVAAGAVTLTNISDGKTARGTSGAANVHNDVLKSQVTMVDDNGRLLASFYRVNGAPQQYTRATATVSGGGTVTAGIGEFSDMQELRDLMELVLRDTQLTNYAASTDLDIDMDKFGQVSLGGTGLVQEFRLVMNADNTEMLSRFSGIAMTDAAAVATTQARVDASGDVIATPSLALGTRAVHASQWWFNTTGLENYGYSATNPATEYGEFAGLRFDGGAQGSGYGMVQLSLVNALGTTVTKEFSMVPRDADANQNEFSSMGELSRLVQSTLRSSDFSSIAADGTLQADSSATASFTGGRLSVATANGIFQNLTLTPVNTTGDATNSITRSDNTNFGTVLGQLATGVNGKLGSSNLFINADASSQSNVFDSQGNEHTVTSYFVRDRSSGLTNIEWKFKTGLNPNLNSFASDSTEQGVYANTYNTLQDTATSRGVLAFDITTGEVLGATSGGDPRYSNTANVTFTATTDSQEANQSNITVDFANLTSFNGQNTVVSNNVDGYAMGSLVRIVTEENTGNINGVYSNGKIRTLAKLGLMHMANPEGLVKVGSSYYTQTPNSSANGTAKGLDQVFAVGAQSPQSSDSVSSRVHGGSLEGSNVDLTEELTDMITTQRTYSASGKIIMTSDEMLQEALNLKR